MAVTAETPQLRRLVTELWRPGDLTTGTTPDGFESHALIGGGEGGALTVVPLSSAKVAASTMIRWTDATTASEGVLRAAAWVGLRTGVARPLLRSRVNIRVSGGEGPSLNQYLAAELNQNHVSVAGAFGSERPNQKPVLRVFGEAGQSMGFAKVGWNELTRRLVDDEWRMLELLAGRNLRTIVAPQPLHSGTWNDRSIALSSALVGSARLGKARGPGLPALEEVAGLSERFRTRLGSSPYRAALSRRAAAVGDSAAVAEALALVDQKWPDEEIEFGHWHGDWAPWNVRRTGDRFIVWDWERSGAGVPVGFDALHFAFQPRFAKTERPLSALAAAVEEVRPLLTGLGVHGGAVVPVAVLYLVELALRFLDAGDGRPRAATTHAESVESLLVDAVRHFGR